MWGVGGGVEGLESYTSRCTTKKKYRGCIQWWGQATTGFHGQGTEKSCKRSWVVAEMQWDNMYKYVREDVRELRPEPAWS